MKRIEKLSHQSWTTKYGDSAPTEWVCPFLNAYEAGYRQAIEDMERVANDNADWLDIDIVKEIRALADQEEA